MTARTTAKNGTAGTAATRTPGADTGKTVQLVLIIRVIQAGDDRTPRPHGHGDDDGKVNTRSDCNV